MIHPEEEEEEDVDSVINAVMPTSVAICFTYTSAGRLAYSHSLSSLLACTFHACIDRVA